MKSSHLILLIFGGGIALMSAGLTGLNAQKEGLHHHQNPFAIRKSGFGKMVARLSQNTVDIVWHLGIEQVNPLDHGHGDHDHDNDHDHEHGDHEDHDHNHEQKAPVKLSDADLKLLTGAGIDVKTMHCELCAKAALDTLKQGHGKEMALAAAEEAEVFALLPEPGEAEETGHVHDEHCKHDHGGAKESVFKDGWLAGSVEWMQDLGLRRYDRTNPVAVSEAHKQVIAQDISDMFYRGYMMDPTDYGVYNGFFLFLTTGEYGGTEATRKHARVVSENTIAEALRETTDAQAWVTAAMAQLNLFFLDEDEFRLKGQTMPVPLLTEHRQKMGYLLQQAGVLIEKAKSEGRWDSIAEDRRHAMEERIELARKSSGQFEKLLELAQKGIQPSKRGEASGDPVADKGESSAADTIDR